MPRIEKSEDLEWVEAFIEAAPQVLPKKVRDSFLHIARLARLGALVEMMPGIGYGDEFVDLSYKGDSAFHPGLMDHGWLACGDRGTRRNSATAALEAAFGLDAGEGE